MVAETLSVISWHSWSTAGLPEDWGLASGTPSPRRAIRRTWGTPGLSALCQARLRSRSSARDPGPRAGQAGIRPSQHGFPRGRCWGLSCSASFLRTCTRALSAPTVRLQMAPRWGTVDLPGIRKGLQRVLDGLTAGLGPTGWSSTRKQGRRLLLSAFSSALQKGLPCFQGRGIHGLAGQPVPLSPHPHRKEFLPNLYSQSTPPL